jgi:hypothetical protein
MNREPSPNRLAFHIARTTISPNYPGEELETLDREVLVISTDVPPQDGETNEHTSNTKTPTPLELFADNKNSLELPQLQVNTQLMLGKAMTTLDNKHPRHQQTLSIVNFERDGLEVYNSPKTNLGAALAPLNHFEVSYGVTSPS